VDDLSGIGVQNAIMIVYPTNVTDNVPGTTKLGQLSVKGSRVEIEYSRFDFHRRMQELLDPYKDRANLRVIIDISAMASYVVYRVLKAVWEMLPKARFAVYYAEAADYSPTEAEWKEFFAGVSDPSDNLTMAESYEQRHFQSRGIDVTYDSDIFPGQNVGALATEVVAVPSFSLLRMKAMLAHAESHYNVPEGNVRWFLGQPPDRIRNGWRFDALAALYNVRNSGEAVSTRDYREIFQKLDSLWGELLAERHIVVASVGSKMQHLGTFFFLMVHQECGQLFCEPQEFIAAQYTRGVGPKWWIDFGSIESIRDAITSCGTLQFRW
jgi:hypothetical protein